MNGLETIGVFSCITLLTLLIWFALFLISDKDSDDKTIPFPFIFASTITILILITLLALVTSEYVGYERKINEYKEKLSKYEKMEIEDEADS